MEIGSAAKAAEILTEARRSGHRVADLPAELKPADWAEVNRIQDATIALQGPIGGWKVSPVDRGTGRICVPIPQSYVHTSPATLPLGAFAPEIEVEIGVRIGRDLPAAAEPYTAETVADAVASLHLVFEVVGSRFLDRKVVGQMTAIADLGTCAAIVIGAPISDWRGIEVGGVKARLTIGGTEAGASDGGWTTAEMLEALAALANHAAARCGGLKAGAVVITGARIGPLPAQLDTPIEATAGGFEPMQLLLR